MDELKAEIRAAERRVKLLRREQQAIAADIRELRQLRNELRDAVSESARVYLNLQKSLNEMIELVPFTASEREELRRQSSRGDGDSQ
jgi:uncharacterized coiled-coil DUF342 family protein